ncbi:MAG TPA: ClbS/DfsB family four-helix bundle protein [Actinomycetota bacterium]|nr:ClbS/DfsB family four-helix bundle protein [Actinomycetota bacterium]
MPPERQEALATIRDGDARLAALFARLDEEAFVRRGTIGDGDWSAKDLMGHIALWEEIALACIDPWLRGEDPELEERFTQGNADAINAWNERRKLEWPLARVRDEAARTHTELVERIEAMTDEEWSAPKRFEDERSAPDLATQLGGILSADRPFNHADAHLPDLEAYVTSLGDPPR